MATERTTTDSRPIPPNATVLLSLGLDPTQMTDEAPTFRVMADGNVAVTYTALLIVDADTFANAIDKGKARAEHNAALRAAEAQA